MPELPEVETTRRGIDAVATGHRLKRLIVHETRMRWPIPTDMAQRLQGQVVRACKRRGKYLLLEFDEGTQLVHLGMSGSLRSVMHGELLRKHDHVEWEFEHATLRLHDPRRFGAVLWHDAADGPVDQQLAALGFEYSYTGNATHAWLTVLLMDVWHWTPLVALLGYAGLRSIPDAYYQAASIDGASKLDVFWYVQLPKMRGVLMIAVLLRFMDSFMIYTEPFVLTGGGPGNSTTFLSQFLTQKAVGQFDLGPAAAFSLIYFLIILLMCFVLYNWMQRVGTQAKEAGHE